MGIENQQTKDEAADAIVHIFGSDHPHRMPGHFLDGAVYIDCETAERADISRQNYSVAPRFWYLDLTFICGQCHQKFVWSRDEQRFWFETLRIWIDSYPLLCPKCRAAKREMLKVRRSYDSGIAQALACRTVPEKVAMIRTLHDYQALGGVLSSRMAENLGLLERQMQNLEAADS